MTAAGYHQAIYEQVGLPRLRSLSAAPGGGVLACVDELDAGGTSYESWLWHLATDDQQAPRRYARARGLVGRPHYDFDGRLLVIASELQLVHADVSAGAGNAAKARRIWGISQGKIIDYLLPETVDVRPAVADRRVVLALDVVAGSEAPAELEASPGPATNDAVSGHHVAPPGRFWDDYMGPRQRRLFVAESMCASPLKLLPLTTGVGYGLHRTEFVLTPDGSTVITTIRVGQRQERTLLAAIDTGSGKHKLLFDQAHSSVGDLLPMPDLRRSLAVSPDSRYVAYIATRHASRDEPPGVALRLLDLISMEHRELVGGDLWPEEPVWAPDGSAVYFVADQDGRAPIFRIDVTQPGNAVDAEPTLISADGAFSDVIPTSDGASLYAVRSAIDTPPEVVRLSAHASEEEVSVVHQFAVPRCRSITQELRTVARDGTPLRGWVVSPAESDSAPHPLLVLVHGGPLASWNRWHWRWSPHVFAAAGFAVLLPDPALSTGYRRTFLERGWGRWGEEPFSDVIDLVQAASRWPTVDGTRAAAAGWSFGGYLVNWIAGHSSLFRCYVVHAGQWSLLQFLHSTDTPYFWEREFGDPENDETPYRYYSPDRSSSQMRRPMLLTHGERDFRVPITEALRQQRELASKGVDVQLLRFPDENHWIVKPPNVRQWYREVVEFLRDRLERG
jgi:dipeptidyl aminopeptidase/acylaminoacyl peptidase